MEIASGVKGASSDWCCGTGAALGGGSVSKVNKLLVLAGEEVQEGKEAGRGCEPAELRSGGANSLSD